MHHSEFTKETTETRKDTCDALNVVLFGVSRFCVWLGTLITVPRNMEGMVMNAAVGTCAGGADGTRT